MHFLSPLTSTQWGLTLYFSSGIDLLKRWISISGQLLDPLLCLRAPIPPLSPSHPFFSSSLSFLLSPFPCFLPFHSSPAHSYYLSLSSPSFLLLAFLSVCFCLTPSLSFFSFLHSFMHISFLFHLLTSGVGPHAGWESVNCLCGG